MQEINSSAAKIAECFKPNTVLWAFHTIQPSRSYLTLRHSGDVKIVFFWYSILGTKNSIFSIIVYQPTRETGSDRSQVQIISPAVRRQHADVSLVVPSAPRPRDSLQFRLQQQWCIPPIATVWRIQTLARQTVARGIVDQRLLRRRTGAHQLRRDKADMIRGGPTDKPANACQYHRRVNWKRHTESRNLTLIDESGSVFSKQKASNRAFTVQMRYMHTAYRHWSPAIRGVCSVSPPLYTSHLQSAWRNTVRIQALFCSHDLSMRVVCLLHSPTQITADYYDTRYRQRPYSPIRQCSKWILTDIRYRSISIS